MNLRSPIVSLNVNDHCRRAAELMKEFHIRHLPVVDQEVPVGMVSERNLLSAIGWWGNGPDHSNATISDLAERLPDNGNLAGIMTESDLLKAMVSELEED